MEQENLRRLLLGATIRRRRHGATTHEDRLGAKELVGHQIHMMSQLQGNPRQPLFPPQGRHGARGLVSLLIHRPNQLNHGSQRQLCLLRGATRRRRHGATTHEGRRWTKELLWISLPLGRHGANGLASLLIHRSSRMEQENLRRLLLGATIRRRRHGATTHKDRLEAKELVGHQIHMVSQLRGNPRQPLLLGASPRQGRHGARGLISLLILRSNQLNHGSQRRLCLFRAATRRRRHEATTHEGRLWAKELDGHLTHKPSQL
jgi:hypothetical protein